MAWYVCCLGGAYKRSAKHGLFLGGPREDTVALVGLGEQGETVVKSIPLADYTQSVGAMISTVQTSVEPALTSHEQNAIPAASWELRTVAVGCTITAQIGLGPIWSISPQARLRLVFSNSTSPVYPD
jgi:hypothetical protein